MSLYSKFQTSPKLETEGVALEIADTKIIVARAGGNNQKFNVAAAKMARKHKRAVDYDLMSDEQGRAILYDLYAEHVVLDWFTDAREEGAPEPDWQRGIEMPDGSLGEVTVENIVMTFKNLPDLFAAVKETAENITYFRQSLIDGATKN